MSHPDPDPHQHHAHASIALQDLSRPPDHDERAALPHRRTLSDRGRNLLRHTGAIATGGHSHRPQYSPLVEASPSPTRHAPRLNTVAAAPGGIRSVPDDERGSPIDAGAFQAAIGFGMSMDFQGETTPPAPTPPSSSLSYSPYGRDAYADGRDPDPYAPGRDHGYFSPPDDDTACLTDARHLQPISGAAANAAPAGHARSGSFQSVRFLSPGARHDHDLGQEEAAAPALRDSRGRKRSLSPAQLESPLQRAGAMMRNMSQRVVNVSNDSHVAERTLARKSTLPHARLAEPPSFPGVPEYATDGPASPSPSPSPSTAPIEKLPSPVVRQRTPSATRQRNANPLRGKSLGIFSADNKLRVKLCNILVHPATEPLLLFLIFVQTVLLALDAQDKVVYDPARTSAIGNFRVIDFSLLGLFVIYTLEIVVRVIVSGFFFNPVEHSTINRQVGLREALKIKFSHLFGGPQRQPSLTRTGTSTDPTLEPQQPSVLRSFTTAQMRPDDDGGIVDSRHQQRVRLAHRAYLRHSFNRTDFVAVVSFWIAFLLGLANIENSRVTLVFDMLSCLRIIRLLNLTSGTSVGQIATEERSNTNITQGHPPESEKSCSNPSQCRILNRLLLAALLHCRRAELQV